MKPVNSIQTCTELFMLLNSLLNLLYMRNIGYHGMLICSS
jgi:hypothetical protein